jgi:hypothetical protein
MSATSYYPYDYTLELSDCASGDSYKVKTASAANPHPDCTVSGSVKINSASYTASGNLEVDQTVDQDVLYTCSIVDLSAELSHDTYGSQAYNVTDGTTD